MDWSEAKDYQIKSFLLDLWKAEADAITKGEGKWVGTGYQERIYALEGTSAIINRILDTMENGNRG